MKNQKALNLMFLAHGISGVAQGISMLSIPWYFAQNARSADFNFYYALTTLLSFVWSVWAGSLVDKFSRKSVFLGTNIIEGILMLFFAGVGFYYQFIPDWAVVGAFAMTVTGFSIHYPNLYAFCQEITPSENYTKVTSSVEVVGQATNVLSGVLGAFLLEGVSYKGIEIEAWTIWEIFALDASTYFISIFLIVSIRYEALKVRQIISSSFWEQLRVAWNFLQKNPKILIFGTFSYTIFIVSLVNTHALIPIYVKNHLQATGFAFGAAKMTSAAGSLFVGAVSSNYFFARMSKNGSIIFFHILAIVSVSAMIFSQNLYIFLTASLLFGFSNAGARIFRLSHIFDKVPNELIGRTNSAFSVLGIMARVALIMLVSLPFFSEASNILFAYGLIALVLIFSTWILKKYA